MDFSSVVVAASTTDLSEEVAAREAADAMEFRMDLADSPLQALDSYSGVLPLIVTNRSAQEGGEATDENRLETVHHTLPHPSVHAIDLELSTIEAGDAAAVLDAAKEHHVSVIASVHDFEGTPPPSELDEMLARASDVADVGKLAVTASQPADTLDLLRATHRATQAGRQVATMSMGDIGRHTRAIAPCYGSRITYAPVDSDRATAPGQYELTTLRSLIDRLC